MPVRILIAAGGTVGHVAPALAVADALRALGSHVEFAGTPQRIESELVPAHGYPFHPFHVQGFPRRPSVALIRALGRAAAAPRTCSQIIGAVQPDVVFGGGGYVAGPMIIAARNVVTGTPHEASSCSTCRRERKCSLRSGPISPSPPR